jgi:hypothetical protein
MAGHTLVHRRNANVKRHRIVPNDLAKQKGNVGRCDLSLQVTYQSSMTEATTRRTGPCFDTEFWLRHARNLAAAYPKLEKKEKEKLIA